jgi:hypothetical protein
MWIKIWSHIYYILCFWNIYTFWVHCVSCSQPFVFWTSPVPLSKNYSRTTIKIKLLLFQEVYSYSYSKTPIWHHCLFTVVCGFGISRVVVNQNNCILCDFKILQIFINFKRKTESKIKIDLSWNA